MADIQSGTTSSGWGVKDGESLVDVNFLCELSGSSCQGRISFQQILKFTFLPVRACITTHWNQMTSQLALGDTGLLQMLSCRKVPGPLTT